MPTVAIGLPVFNGENYVGAAIESVLSQTDEDFELVISDNASGDGTEEICRSFAASDSRVRYFRSETNLGAAPNFNRCLALTRDTPYFKWISHDDLIDARFLELCRQALDAAPHASLALPEYVEIDDTGTERRRSSADFALPDSQPGARVRRLIDLARDGGDVYWGLYGLIRRSKLMQTFLHGNYIAADQVLLFELALLGSWVFVPGTAYTRRVHVEASAAANRTPAALLHWYDTTSSSQVPFRHWTLMAHHLGAVRHLDLERREQVKAYMSIARRSVREWRNLGGDVRRALASWRASRALRVLV